MYEFNIYIYGCANIVFALVRILSAEYIIYDKYCLYLLTDW